MKNIILVNQRLDKVGKFKELRDNLDIRFSKLILDLNMDPFLVPNNLRVVNNILKKNIKIKGIILSSGGNPKINDERSKVENRLIKFSIQKKVPLLGICRGAQKINLFFGGKIKKIKNHVRKNHKIFGVLTKNKIVKVNSYHNFGVANSNIPKTFNILATTKDGFVECFADKNYRLMGIMWHPERYKHLRNFEKKILKKFFRCN